jgi:translation initiation factor IF-3
MAELKIPTETVTLPSKGLLYPETSPLAKGEIEMKYMTAKEEDILSNSNYIRQGTVIDKLLQALIVTPIDYNELLIGDKNAILIAARILGYGKDYNITFGGTEYNVDLTQIQNKEVDFSLFKRGTNDFSYTLPHSNNVVTFKILTHGDEQKIEAEIKGLQKVNPNQTTDITTRMKHMITSVEGKRDQKDIREFVDNYLIAKDARALRQYYSTISPDLNMKYIPTDENYTGEGIDIPININFLWPDIGV